MSDINVDKVVKKFNATHRRNVAASGPFLRDGVLGTIMGELLERDGIWPSAADVKKEVLERISRTPSASGKMDVADDITRAPLEHLLMLLEGFS